MDVVSLMVFSFKRSTAKALVIPCIEPKKILPSRLQNRTLVARSLGVLFKIFDEHRLAPLSLLYETPQPREFSI